MNFLTLNPYIWKTISQRKVYIFVHTHFNPYFGGCYFKSQPSSVNLRKVLNIIITLFNKNVRCTWYLSAVRIKLKIGKSIDFTRILVKWLYNPSQYTTLYFWVQIWVYPYTVRHKSIRNVFFSIIKDQHFFLYLIYFWKI